MKNDLVDITFTGLSIMPKPMTSLFENAVIRQVVIVSGSLNVNCVVEEFLK